MSNEIQQIWLKGKTLTADVFQPDGTEREFNISPLTEHAGTDVSLYTGDCATIQAGDIIANSDANNRLIGGGKYKESVSGIGAASAVIKAGYVGDYNEDGVVHFLWHTSVAPSTDGIVKVYKDNGTDEITVPTGITDTRNFDSKTGVHLCSVNLAASSFYAREKDYLVVLSDAIINGVTLYAVIATFSVEKRWTNPHFHYGGT